MQNKTKTMIDSISENQSVNGLKFVKNAMSFNQNGVFYIKHYNTVIVAYNPKSDTLEANWNLSQTSNRQIRYAIQYFGVKESNIIDVSNNEIPKWSKSGDRTN
jgi:hypothetical protein